MKRKIILLAVFVALSASFIWLLCNGIFDRNIEMEPIEIYIETSGGFAERAIFRVTHDGMLITNVEKVLGVLFPQNLDTDSVSFKFNFDYNCEDTLDPEYTKQAKRKLTRKQRNQIVELTNDIKKTGDEFTETFKRWNVGTGPIRSVHMNVDGKTYSSWYTTDGVSYDRANALQELTYMLVNISPINIAGNISSYAKLNKYGKLFCFESYVFFVNYDGRIYGMNGYKGILLAVFAGLILCLGFGLLAKFTHIKSLNKSPYFICLIADLVTFIMLVVANNKFGTLYGDYNAQKLVEHYITIFVYLLFITMSVVAVNAVIFLIKHLKNKFTKNA